MRADDEKYLTGIAAMALAGAFFPTMAVIADPPQTGPLHYIDDDVYPIEPYEEIEQIAKEKTDAEIP